MKEPLPVVVVGAGHMGRHHVRKYAEMESTKLIAVIDANIERAREMAVPLGVKYGDSLTPEMGDVAAASVAVPTVHHLKVAGPLIERGVAVLVEKPLAHNLSDARKIAELAKKHETIVQVGHTERFNPAVRAVDQLGLKPKFVETHRISPFTFRSADVGVVFDMMIHDIDILLHLVSEPIERVDAVGVNVISTHEDITNARVTFSGGAVANLTASRLALKTERKLRVFCEHAYVSLDYQKKVSIAITLDKNLDIMKLAREHNVEALSQLAGMDFGKMVTVEPLTIHDKDALQDELETFIECVREKQQPPVSAEAGVKAVHLASKIVDAVKGHCWDGDTNGRVGLDADIVRSQTPD